VIKADLGGFQLISMDTRKKDQIDGAVHRIPGIDPQRQESVFC